MSEEATSSSSRNPSTSRPSEETNTQVEARRTAADIRAEIHRRLADFDVRLAELRRQEDEIWFDAEQQVAELRDRKAEEAEQLRDDIDRLEDREREAESMYERYDAKHRSRYSPRVERRTGRTDLADVLREIPDIIPMRAEAVGYAAGRLIDAFLDPLRSDRRYGPSRSIDDVVEPFREGVDVTLTGIRRGADRFREGLYDRSARPMMTRR